LATPSELERVTGMAVSEWRHAEFPSDCGWQNRSQTSYQVTPVVTYEGIQVSYVPRVDFDGYAALIGHAQPGNTAQRVAGLGDDALVYSYGAMSELYVRKGSVVFSVAVSSSPTPPHDVEMEQAVAKLLLPKI
jgi:hypothetical protein